MKQTLEQDVIDLQGNMKLMAAEISSIKKAISDLQKELKELTESIEFIESFDEEKLNT